MLRWSRLVPGPTLAVAFFLAFQRPAYAHMRWFVGEGSHSDVHFPIDFISIFIVFGSIAFVFTAIAIDRMGRSGKTSQVWDSLLQFIPENLDWRIVAVSSGILLIANSLTGVFLAPNISISDDGLLFISGAAQLVVGLLLLSQRSFSLAGLMVLVVVVPLAAANVPGSLLMDYIFEFASLGIAFVLIGMRVCYLDHAVCRWLRCDVDTLTGLSLLMVRVGIGLTLVVLAMHAKLLSPGLALSFLDTYDLNFMNLMGFTSFTNLHFALAAGVAELTFGLLLISGIATRFVTAVLGLFFLSTTVVFGPMEVLGHLPLFGIILLLVLRGSGSYRLPLWTRPAPAV